MARSFGIARERRQVCAEEQPAIRKRVNAKAIACGALLCAALSVAACGGDDDDEPATTPTTTAAEAPTETNPPEEPNGGSEPADDEPPEGEPPEEEPEESDDGQPAPEPSGPSAEVRQQRAVMRVVRAYVEGLVDHDGARVCSLFAPGALDSLELPVERGDCASSLSASIGYRDPRGIPWRDTRIQEFVEVSVTPPEARATVSVFTRFAGDREPSIEDDLIYLERSGEEWLIVKPSTTIYRAIGTAEIPLDAIRPPS
jgi:hypothetical protein